MASNPWHAECGICRAWLVPPRSTICAQCEEKQNAYADAMIKRDKDHFYTSNEWDTDTSGAPLKGSGSREAMHKRHMQARKDKDE